MEDPDGGDPLRAVGPSIGEHGAWFTALNRGKRSVALDLRTAQGREDLLVLLGGADVLVESFRPGVLARLGLDPEILRARFPRLVIASLTGWGQSGPWARRPAHDLNFLAISGILGLDLAANGEPRVPALQWADLSAGGLAAALRIVAALLTRERSGRGCWLDIAMLDGLIGLQQTHWALAAAGVERDTLLSGEAPMYGLYRTRDERWVSVAALEPDFLSHLWAAAEGDVTHRGLATLFESDTHDAWDERLPDACVAPVLSPAEARRHPQVVARELFREDGLAHPPTGPVAGAPPRLGEHTALELGR